MSGAPYGYRYITVHEGGGQARLEPIAEQAHVVRQIFKWVGQDRCSISDVCGRLKESGELTATGRTFWSRTVVWHILHNPAYQGQAAYGKTRMMPRTKKNRSRPACGRPLEPRRSHVAISVDLNEWVCIPVPALVDPALFHAVEQQLHENRSRARLGRRRPGYLLQGLTCCAICGYAYYGKTLHQRGAGGVFRDFWYYRCSGSDGYRFGGEPVCSNKQINGDLLEAAVWREVSDLVANPEKLEQQYEGSHGTSLSDRDLESLKAQRTKLAHAVERLIDSYTEGLIDKDQFTSRANRTKKSIADLDAKIKADTGTVGQAERLRGAVARLREMAATLGPGLPELDWNSRRDVIRLLVQRIEIGTESIRLVFRLTQDKVGSAVSHGVVIFPRPVRATKRP
jgi:site-specific DNA recombinase